MTDSPRVSGLSGRRVLVTGAGGGIGTAVCAALRNVGATVIGWDLTSGAGVDTAVDVTDRDAVAEAWRALESEAPVDVVISAAGVMSDDWDRCMAVNATGVRNVLDITTASLAGRRSGSVVVISSNAGATPRIAMSAYAASKAAATSYARSVGLAVASAGVRVNIVSPGSTDTPMLRDMWSSDADRDAVLAGDQQAHRLGIPLQRIADPADIAESVLFLASDAARHITLHDLRVDGGATLDM
ncbi:SDR family NAD(P)-dependent oxidoreductase [Gordonia sp. NB41Y]|uniref:SDR family NAD(P)-dependent oxidoreductase n=1 Tax=Gordonia sp. NB41Y TaxID=875808 RepID=UPI0006B2187A|nr:SDR family NAD(P)-dependent oxidoreductase [Gordonia sp. NB41Y]EMP13472.2 2,3-dihydroxybenzoate-2,3-dehydrogenase [Gordonia sp. NB41Y]WLP90912.1 SDR family oxidoreductase [Gordonia sp. NB41Y]